MNDIRVSDTRRFSVGDPIVILPRLRHRIFLRIKHILLWALRRPECVLEVTRVDHKHGVITLETREVKRRWRSQAT